MYKWKDGFEPNICIMDEHCRYVLGKKGNKTMICIGANPSVAERREYDAEMNLFCAILENNGYDGFIMLNLYPLIATNPDELADFDEKIHAKNLAKIKAVLAEYKNSDILLCYGVVLKKRKYLQKCLDDILSLCSSRNIKCLDAITKDSYLPHPSRKSKTIKIIDFKIKSENK